MVSEKKKKEEKKKHAKGFVTISLLETYQLSPLNTKVQRSKLYRIVFVHVTTIARCELH